MRVRWVGLSPDVSLDLHHPEALFACDSVRHALNGHPQPGLQAARDKFHICLGNIVPAQDDQIITRVFFTASYLDVR